MSPRARRFAELRQQVRGEDAPNLLDIDDALRGIQEKHHPGSFDVTVDRDFLDGSFPEDDLDELDEWTANGGDA